MARRSRSRIDDLIEEQGEALERLRDREVKRVLRSYEDARRELRDRLTTTPPALEATTQHLRVMLAQTEAGIASMKDRLGVALDEAQTKAQQRAINDTVKLVKKAEPRFRDTGGQVEVAVVRNLATRGGLALHRHSLDRYGATLADEIQRRLVSGVVQGMTVRELAESIAGADASLFAKHRGRAALIARMELAHAHDVAARASIEELADLDEIPDEHDPLLKKADEHIDRRNHPFSRALDGKVARPREEFEVTIAEIPGGKTGGIVWARKGSVFYGQGYPAHFGDRGRVVPWRMSWGGEEWREPVSKRAEPVSPSDLAGLRRLARGEPHGLNRKALARLRLNGLMTNQAGALVPTPSGLERARSKEG